MVSHRSRVCSTKGFTKVAEDLVIFSPIKQADSDCRARKWWKMRRRLQRTGAGHVYGCVFVAEMFTVLLCSCEILCAKSAVADFG